MRRVLSFVSRLREKYVKMEFAMSYLTLASAADAEYTVNRSRFIAHASPVESAEAANAFIDAVRAAYPDATHNVFAFQVRSPEYARYSDDGEPSGTGGRPIHGQLLSADLTDTLIVVVRYFGGILLGASGLANAYKAAARDAISHATIVEKTIDITYRLHFEYPLMNDVMRLLKELGVQPRNQEFNLDCRLDISVRQSQSVRVYDTLAKLYGLKITTL